MDITIDYRGNQGIEAIKVPEITGLYNYIAILVRYIWCMDTMYVWYDGQVAMLYDVLHVCVCNVVLLFLLFYLRCCGYYNEGGVGEATTECCGVYSRRGKE